MSLSPTITAVRRRRPSPGVALSSLLILLAAVACDPAGTSSRGPSGDSLFGQPLPDGASLDEILRHPDIFERARAVGTFFQQARPEQLDEIQDAFRRAPLDRGDIEYALFGAWWARFNPAGALFYAQNDLRMEQPRVINEVLRTWAFMDPEGLEAAAGFEDAASKLFGFRSEMMDAVVVGWFESGKPGLDEFILGQVDPTVRQSGLQAWVRMKVFHEGEVEALEWTQNVEYHADTKRLLLAAALALIAHQNPQLCIEWFHKAKEAGIDVNTFVPRITNAWGHHDPQAAIEWALTFPESPERLRAIQRVARKWRDQDIWGLQDWLDANEGRRDPKVIGILRYATLNQIVERAGYRPDWRDLLRRANELGDENRAAVVSLWILQRWLYAEPEAAQAWIAENPYGMEQVVLDRAPLLPDADKEKIDRALGRLATDQL